MNELKLILYKNIFLAYKMRIISTIIFLCVLVSAISADPQPMIFNRDQMQCKSGCENVFPEQAHCYGTENGLECYAFKPYRMILNEPEIDENYNTLNFSIEHPYHRFNMRDHDGKNQTHAPTPNPTPSVMFSRTIIIRPGTFGTTTGTTGRKTTTSTTGRKTPRPIRRSTTGRRHRHTSSSNILSLNSIICLVVIVLLFV